jgi:hypothetical protein
MISLFSLETLLFLLYEILFALTILLTKWINKWEIE